MKMSELTDLCGNAHTLCQTVFIKWENIKWETSLYKMGESDSKCMD